MARVSRSKQRHKSILAQLASATSTQIISWHFLSVVLSLLCSTVGLRLLLQTTLNSSERLFVPLAVILILVYFFIICLPFAFVALSLIAVRQGTPDRARQLALILTSYISVTIVFAGAYYSVCLVDGYNRTVSEFYGSPSNAPFDGIKLQLFSLGEPASSSQDLLLNLARNDSAQYKFPNTLRLEDAMSFQPVASAPILIDCLYLSATTMTLFGYGPVQPSSPSARITNAVQLVLAVLFLFGSLGMLLADWWTEEYSRTKRPAGTPRVARARPRPRDY